MVRWLDGRDGHYGPGTAWTAGHVLFLASLIGFAVTLVLLSRVISGGRIARLVAAVLSMIGLFGLLGFIRVVIIDLVVGFQADSPAEMGATQFDDDPNMLPAGFYDMVHDVAPLCFALSLVGLLVQVAITRRQMNLVASPVLTLLGFVILGGNEDLIPLAAGCLGLALAFTAWSTSRQ
jgi:hypothetical protein